MWIALVPLALLALAMSGANARASTRPSCSATATPLARGLAAKWGKVFGVPEALVLGIIAAESCFRPDLTNMNERAQKRGGAWGLMQVTFDTGRSDVEAVKKSHGGSAVVSATLKKWTGMPRDLLDPDLNVMLGAHYLAGLYKRYGGNVEHAVAAYHQGAGTVDKLLRDDGDLRAIKPYGRQYVAMVMPNYRRFA